MFQVFQMYVGSVSYRCCKIRSGCCTCCNGYSHIYFKCMFQIFYLYHIYVANIFIKMLHIHACCKRIFQVVSGVSHVCCKCFIWMLHMFAMIFKCFSGIFTNVSHACFKCFIRLLCLLQLLHRDVSKVNQELHIGYAWKAQRACVARHARVPVRR
jgi:hypothetical protein